MIIFQKNKIFDKKKHKEVGKDEKYELKGLIYSPQSIIIII